MMNGQPETAVFVDLENIYIGFRHQYGRDLTADELVEKARSFGSVKLISVYADFSEPTYPEHFKLDLDNEGVQAINVPKDRDREGRPTKNKIDMRMAVDVLRTLAFRKEFERYVLMTGDKIFLDVLNLARHDFGKEVIVCGLEGTVAQVLKDIAIYVPFSADAKIDERLERFIKIFDRLERELLDGTYHYIGWKLVIEQLCADPEMRFATWNEARDFFERLKRDGRLILKYYPGESREIEAYRLDRRNPLVRKVLGLEPKALEPSPRVEPASFDPVRSLGGS
ncbi:MAG: NYN domain-containing protein [Candidatus Bipolaricaulota bacterium]|nr:NYN domain-containing protein [Candidatus Bipolaricaulota bacterium]MCS7273951.1 NYN domain-containing protein [Candidatus Bipolaricaulota bacterium]MDW8111025.1 NYN domain-containing protein [Candidatus Bipolaricaulota bacterium]MDW8329276.1 NYN domain-containing protein [Candidatus Bipolaricaulota bacterium]